MHVLLPPSETKTDGGDERRLLDLNALGFARLNPVRRAMLAALRSLSSNRAVAAEALRISKAQHFEVDRNRALRRSPTLPAIERYTGVLYDGLDFGSLDVRAREWAAMRVIIHSALFGLLRASDPIPAYRLSHDSRIPRRPLVRTWRNAISDELDRLPGLILDLRSESYVALGPAPAGSFFLRVVTAGEGSTRRALNHFNKKAKGEFVRALATSGIDFPDADSLCAWARDRGLRLEPGAPGELQLVV